jgi:hypothetical protein
MQSLFRLNGNLIKSPSEIVIDPEIFSSYRKLLPVIVTAPPDKFGELVTVPNKFEVLFGSKKNWRATLLNVTGVLVLKRYSIPISQPPVLEDDAISNGIGHDVVSPEMGIGLGFTIPTGLQTVVEAPFHFALQFVSDVFKKPPCDEL